MSKCGPMISQTVAMVGTKVGREGQTGIPDQMMKLNTDGDGIGGLSDEQQDMELMGLMDDELMQLVLKEADDFDFTQEFDVEEPSTPIDGFVSTTTTAPSTPEVDPTPPAKASNHANGACKNKPKTKPKTAKRPRPKGQQSQLVEEVQELEKRVQELLRKRRERQQQQQEKPKRNGVVGVPCNDNRLAKKKEDIQAIRLDNGLGMVIRPAASTTNVKCSSASQQQQQDAHHQMTSFVRQLQELLCNADIESHRKATGSDSNGVKRRRVEDYHQISFPSKTSLLECFDDQTRVQWLLDRLDFSFQQMDLVMQQHLNGFSTLNAKTTHWNMGLLGSSSTLPLTLPFYDESMSAPVHPLVPPQSPFTVLQQTMKMWNPQHEHKVSLFEDFAEMSGSKLTPFDMPTIMDLLWKCFSVQTKVFDDDATAEYSLEGDCLNSVLQGTVQFTACVGRLAMNVHVEIHGALKKTSNEIVWETVGRMSPVEGLVVADLESYAKTLPYEQQVSLALAQTEFTRSAWCRIDPLPDGRTVVHHVHRIAPMLNPVPDDSLQARFREDKTYRRQQVQVLAEMMDIGREKSFKIMEELIQNQFSGMCSGPAPQFDCEW